MLRVAGIEKLIPVIFDRPHTEELERGITNVVLRGRLDTAHVADIEAQFKAVVRTERAVVVDLSETDYLSSLGVRLLLSGAKVVHDKGGKLVLLSPKDNVRAVLGRPPLLRSGRIGVVSALAFTRRLKKSPATDRAKA